jgi:hypothetical protein
MGASFGRVWRHDTHNQPPGVATFLATFLAEDRAIPFTRHLRKQIACVAEGRRLHAGAPPLARALRS